MRTVLGVGVSIQRYDRRTGAAPPTPPMQPEPPPTPPEPPMMMDSVDFDATDFDTTDFA